jgi:TetR/AcrR family transcriptional regulator, mexCD-oprJ operon repressor
MNPETILRSAADLLGRRPNATTDEIAEAAGISRATLNRYFPGRRALLEAVDGLAKQHMRAAVSDARLGEGSAEEALNRLVAASESVAPYLAVLYSQSQAFEEPDDDEWREIDAGIEELFRRGQDAGEFRLDLSAAWLSDAFYSLVVGTAWSIQVGRAAARGYGHHVTTLLIEGVRRR